MVKNECNQSQSNNIQGTYLTNVETFLCFKVTIRCANLHLPVISEYQHILHDKIKELHDSGLGYRRIACWFNENQYKTSRGHEFKNTHVHSLLKKRRIIMKELINYMNLLLVNGMLEKFNN